MNFISPTTRALAGFLLLTVGGGMLMGLLNTLGPWYAALAKPSFNPPNWVFGPVWTGLYILIAIAGWHTWKHAPKGVVMKLWWTQLALNFLWSPVFFTLHRLDAALVILIAMLGSMLAYAGYSYRRGNRLSALLFLPYIAWVMFAGALNFMLWQLN